MTPGIRPYARCQCALVGVVGMVCWWVGVLEGRLAALEGGLVRVGGGVGDVYCGV